VTTETQIRAGQLWRGPLREGEEPLDWRVERAGRRKAQFVAETQVMSIKATRAALTVLLHETGRHVCKPWVPAWLVISEVRAQASCTPQAASGALRALLTVGLADRAETARGHFWKPTDAAIRSHALLAAGPSSPEGET
jgi:hypothetical protein